MESGTRFSVLAARQLGSTDLNKSDPVPTTIVGIDRKKENSSAPERVSPAISPAAIVDIERDVPGKTADAIWAKPIQAACGRVISSMRSTREWRQSASTNHMMMPPINKAQAMTQ